MRQLPAVIMLFSLVALPQEKPTKPTVSHDSLSPEQVAVYRAVLKDYTRKSDGVLNLADKTDTLDQSDSLFDKSCSVGLQLEDTSSTAPVIHQIDGSLRLAPHVVMVDSDRQQKTIGENDPQNLIKAAIDHGAKFSDKQLGDSVQQAFRTGLFTLSEIVFDKEHRHAMVAYSFVCGMLCGNGNTLVLKKVGQEWKVTKRCGGWVS